MPVWRLKPAGTSALPLWLTFSAVLVESKLPSGAEQLLVVQTWKATLPVSSVSGSLNCALRVGVVESMNAPSAGVSRAGVAGAASGVRFVTAWAPYVATWLSAGSWRAVPE